jgi:hypothetical protein
LLPHVVFHLTRAESRSVYVQKELRLPDVSTILFNPSNSAEFVLTSPGKITVVHIETLRTMVALSMKTVAITDEDAPRAPRRRSTMDQTLGFSVKPHQTTALSVTSAVWMGDKLYALLGNDSVSDAARLSA